jgi:hypothetical protein
MAPDPSLRRFSAPKENGLCEAKTPEGPEAGVHLSRRSPRTGVRISATSEKSHSIGKLVARGENSRRSKCRSSPRLLIVGDVCSDI